METDATPNAAQPKPRRRWSQYSLRTLLIFVTLAGFGFGWFGLKVREARQQQAAVAAIEKAGGVVWYDYEYDQRVRDAVLPGPAWLHALLGDDLFRSVFVVTMYPDESTRSLTDADLEHFEGFARVVSLALGVTQITDAGLKHLGALNQLEFLSVENTRITNDGLRHLRQLTQLRQLSLNGTRVTDAGLDYLQGLVHLEVLDVQGTHVTAEGVAKLQKALPNCEITR